MKKVEAIARSRRQLGPYHPEEGLILQKMEAGQLPEWKGIANYSSTCKSYLANGAPLR
jgi:hypothetical protein